MYPIPPTACAWNRGKRNWTTLKERDVGDQPHLWRLGEQVILVSHQSLLLLKYGELGSGGDDEVTRNYRFWSTDLGIWSFWYRMFSSMTSGREHLVNSSVLLHRRYEISISSTWTHVEHSLNKIFSFQNHSLYVNIQSPIPRRWLGRFRHCHYILPTTIHRPVVYIQKGSHQVLKQAHRSCSGCTDKSLYKWRSVSTGALLLDRCWWSCTVMRIRLQKWVNNINSNSEEAKSCSFVLLSLPQTPQHNDVYHKCN